MKGAASGFPQWAPGSVCCGGGGSVVVGLGSVCCGGGQGVVVVGQSWLNLTAAVAFDFCMREAYPSVQNRCGMALALLRDLAFMS